LGKDKEKSTRSDAPGAEKQQERKEDLSNRAQQCKGSRKMASVLLTSALLLKFESAKTNKINVCLCEDTIAAVPLSDNVKGHNYNEHSTTQVRSQHT
jgi:hypothetical protein